MSGNTEINSSRSIKSIAGDLKAGHELRAKKVNGRLVLYTREVNSLRKWIDNRFHHRADKIEAARVALLDSFKAYPSATRKAILQPIQTPRPGAAAFAEVVQRAEDSLWKGTTRPGRFEYLLDAQNAAALASIMPRVRADAKKQLLTSELDCVVTMFRIGDLSPPEAQKFAARTALRLVNQQLNVDDSVRQHVATGFGLDLKAATRLTPRDWHALIQSRQMSPKQLADIFRPATDALVKTIQDNIYCKLLIPK